MSQYALTLSIGLIISLGLYDGLGIAAGGLVVPGYTAYALGQPLLLLTVIIAGLLAYLLLMGIGSFTILYGRRRFVLAVLLGLLANCVTLIAINKITGKSLFTPDFGYVVPGLLATWLDKQGIISTFSVLTIATVGTGLVVMFLQALGVGG